MVTVIHPAVKPFLTPEENIAEKCSNDVAFLKY